ncbi:MAG TPA: DNA polymerase III subunit gamma/tau [bacterium]|nr:DNA polymerase III subunit gamma/tau [bacterium]
MSFYRKWRPQTFEDVVGQERVTRTLQNAIATGRIVHAYLFCGHRGSGKTTTARILAKCLNCVRGPTPTPDNTCPSCIAIGTGTSLDVIEIDAASNRGIDEIRDLREKVRLVPVEGRYKVYIIDEAHMLTTEAANALLKTLEEPPPHAVLVLVTTEPHRLPTTITSRTQRFDFKRIPQATIVGRLATIAAAESLAVDDDALHLIARSADGALRDAEGLLDQLNAFCRGRITKADVLTVLGVVDEDVAHGMAQAIIDGDAAACLVLAGKLLDEGRDVRQILRSLVDQFRDLLVVAVMRAPQGILETTDQRLQALRAQAGSVAPGMIAQYIRVLAAAEAEARAATQPRVILEMALLRASRPELDPSIESLAARVSALEQGAPAAPRPSGTPAVQPDTKAADAAVPHRPAAGPSEKPVRMAPRSVSPAAEGTEAVDAAPSPAPLGAGTPRGGTPQSPATPSDPLAPLTIDGLRDRWAAVMDDVKQRTRAVHAYLLESAPRDVVGNEVILGVRHPFHLERLEETKNRGIVAESLVRVLGGPFRLRFMLDESVDTDVPSSEGPAPGNAPSGAGLRDAHALVDEAVRRFGNPVQEIRRLE